MTTTLDLTRRLWRETEQRQQTYEIGTLEYAQWGEFVDEWRQRVGEAELQQGPPQSIIRDEEA